MSSPINSSPLKRSRSHSLPLIQNNPKNVRNDSQNNRLRSGSFGLSASKTYVKRTEKKSLMAELKVLVQQFLDLILGSQTEKLFKIGSTVYTNEELKTLREIHVKHPSEQSEEEKALITSFVDYVEEGIQMQWALEESLKLEEDHQLEIAMNKNLKEEFKPLKQKVFEELQLKVAIKESLKQQKPENSLAQPKKFEEPFFLQKGELFGDGVEEVAKPYDWDCKNIRERHFYGGRPLLRPKDVLIRNHEIEIEKASSPSKLASIKNEELLKQFPIEEAEKHSILEGEGYYEIEEPKSENQNLESTQNKKLLPPRTPAPKAPISKKLENESASSKNNSFLAKTSGFFWNLFPQFGGFSGNPEYDQYVSDRSNNYDF